MQSNLRLIGHLRHRYGLRKLFLNPFLALLGNLVVALVGLGDALQLVSNRILDLAHLVTNINHRKVTLAITSVSSLLGAFQAPDIANAAC